MNAFELWIKGCEVNGTKIYPLEGSGQTALYKCWREYTADNRDWREDPIYICWIDGKEIFVIRDLRFAYRRWEELTENRKMEAEEMPNTVKHNLSIDLETFSSIPITSAGAYRYVDSADFEILLFAYSLDGGPVQVIDVASGEEVPEWLKEALTRYKMNVYLLCRPDLPWQQDGARYNGSYELRQELFERYEQEIEELGVPYYIIEHE